MRFTVDISEQKPGNLWVLVVTVTEPESLVVIADMWSPARRHVGVPVRVAVHQFYQSSLVLVAQEVLSVGYKNKKVKHMR